jgi:hypothetical protein
MTIDSSGNVGVGVTASQYKFEVSGSANFSSLYLAGTPVTSTAAELNILDGVTSNYNELNLLDGASGNTGGLVFGNATGNGFTQDSANLFWDDTTNRLGIGTTGPTGSLDVFNTGGALATLGVLEMPE